LLDRDQVCAELGGVPYKFLRSMIRRGLLVEPIKLGPQTARWRRSEVHAALEKLPRGPASGGGHPRKPN
jgi:hypothetical protein